MATTRKTKQTETPTPKRKTKPRKEIDLDLVRKYSACCNNINDVARKLRISPRTFFSRKKESAEFAEAYEEGQADLHVFAGSKLVEAVREGKPWAIEFLLSRRYGWKETTRQELTGANGSPIEINDNRPDLSKIPTETLEKIYKAMYGDS